MAQAGVRRCVLGGSDLETSRRIVALAKKHEGVYGAVGVHPHEAKTWTDETEAELEGMLTQPRVVAVGEIGLDYFYDLSPRDQQREVLIKQLALARAAWAGLRSWVSPAQGLWRAAERPDFTIDILHAALFPFRRAYTVSWHRGGRFFPATVDHAVGGVLPKTRTKAA